MKKTTLTVAVVLAVSASFVFARESDVLTPSLFIPGSTVLFQGDSITDGLHKGDLNHVYGHSYVWEIAARYQAEHPQDRVEFANRGVSGDTSSNLVARWSRDAFPYTITENGYEGAFGRAKGTKVMPDYLSILIGINDYFFAREKDRRAVSCADYEKNLRTLVEEARKANPNVKIVLCEPFRIPVDTTPDFCQRQDVVAKLAAEYDCAFVPFQKLFAEDLLRKNANGRYWFWDFFHATPAGHVAMAQFWLETVERAFARTVRNTALEPRAWLEKDSYDWFERHADVVARQKKVNPEIVFIGDSITHGWEKNDELRGDVSSLFAKEFGKYRTLNLGFGWDRIQNVLWRLSHGELDGTKPRVVVINIGTNNLMPGQRTKFPANAPEEIADGIVAVCRRVREKIPQAKIVLMDVFPRDKKDSPMRTGVQAINAALTPRLAELADANLVRLDLSGKYVGADGEISKELMFDALHPTVKGYEIWAKALAPYIDPTYRPVPAPALLKRIKSGFERYGIVHFSINTFTDREWGYGSEKPAWFNPTAFDADQIVRACKEGGLQGLIIVAKHHDGFCLWRTKTTEHNIAHSPFREGYGDYVQEMQRACARYGLAFGVYVSPWDRNNAAYGTPAYRETFRRQVLELFSGAYGKPFELWFDGANGGDGYYGGARERRQIGKNYYRYQDLIDEVRLINPDICVFYDYDEGELHYPGTEGGDLHPDARASFLSRAQQPSTAYKIVRETLFRGDVNGHLFKQVECDVPLRKGWFYHTTHDGYDRSPEMLMKIYLRTCGNGGTMNIGIAPDRRGLLTDEDVRTLKEFNAIRQKFFAKKVLPENGFNVVVMREDVSDGERVDGWELVLDGRVLASGQSIGIKRIRVMDKVEKGAKLEVRVTKKCGTPGAITTELYSVDPLLAAKVKRAAPPPPPKTASEIVGNETERTATRIVYDCRKTHAFSSVRVSPDLDDIEGSPVNFRLAFSTDGLTWREDTTDYRLDNIAANPIPQVLSLGRTENARYVRLDAVRTLAEGAPLARIKLALIP